MACASANECNYFGLGERKHEDASAAIVDRTNDAQILLFVSIVIEDVELDVVFGSRRTFGLHPLRTVNRGSKLRVATAHKRCEMLIEHGSSLGFVHRRISSNETKLSDGYRERTSLEAKRFLPR